MGNRSAEFESTLWSQVILAARSSDTDQSAEALARLCTIYWYPIYVFIRRQGAKEADAQDLTQSFFEHVLSSGFLSRADPDKGRFRNFLLGAVRNHLLNDREKNVAQKRGGLLERVSIHPEVGEAWLAAEPSPTNDPTKAFDRAWANTVLNEALQTLEHEQYSIGKARQFSILKQYLQRSPGPGEYERLGGELKMNKGAIAAAVHRLNLRYGELVRKSVAATVSSPQMAEDELRYLLSALHG